MFAFVSEEATRSAAKYNRQNDLDVLISSLSEAKSIEEKMHPLGQGIWKKRIGPFRFFAESRNIEGNAVACILDVRRRDDGYDDFPDDLKRANNAALKTWVEAEIAARRVPTASKEELPTALCKWLEPPSWNLDDLDTDLVIYESDTWIQRFKDPTVGRFWKTYLDIVGDIIAEADQVNSSDRSLLSRSREGRVVHFILLDTADTPSRKLLVLLSPSSEFTPGADPLASLLCQRDRPIVIDDLIPYVGRCYPAYLTLDQNAWEQIQSNEEANLALSAEEEAILKAVSQTDGGELSLPIFINGRAGSGKSTMLAYLFADFCHRYLTLTPGESERPLFLAYNDRLVEVVKRSVKTLLSCHHKFVTSAPTATNGEIDDLFTGFQRFILNRLPSTVRNRFTPEKYVSFHRFKQMYQRDAAVPQDIALKLPSGGDFSPELAWYVIRTFIKGYSDEAFLELEDYLDLGRRERGVVTEKDFKSIEATIWKKWYRGLLEKGYWDDQDLVRAALNSASIRPDHSAIFCDEAQDFTRIELKFLMRLSSITKYVLPPEAKSLPFAFAGDPFQTLNPTGFRSSSLKSTFYQEIVQTTDPSDQCGLKMHVQELYCNYRSESAIVKATNTIQLWRRILFDFRDLRPQRWLAKGNQPDPEKYIVTDDGTPIELKRRLQDSVVILPCEEPQVVEFIKKDKLLSSTFPVADEKDVPPYVFSVMAVKGLEFPTVVLYKFGEECNPNIWNLLDQPKSDVRHEFYFNRLYVAATRPKKTLMVVDSPKGDDQLWARAASEEKAVPFLARLKDSGERELWRDCLGFIQHGVAESMFDLQRDDRLQVAEELRTKGEKEVRPDWLRRAQKIYVSLGKNDEAALCEAWYLAQEGQFKKSGDTFLRLKYIERALQIYLKGLCWEEVLECCELLNQKGTVLEIASFMLDGTRPGLLRICDFLLSNPGLSDPTSACWKEVSGRIQSQLRTASVTSTLTKRGWRQAGATLSALSKGGFEVADELIGEVLYKGEDYSECIKHYEAAGKTQSHEYYVAKANTVEGVARLEFLNKAKEKNAILAEWAKLSVGFSREDRLKALPIVVPCLEGHNRYLESLQLRFEAKSVDDLSGLYKAVGAAFKSASAEERRGLLESLLKFLHEGGELVEALDCVDQYAVQCGFTNNQRIEWILRVATSMANSTITPDVVNRERQTRLSRLIRDAIDATPDWKKRIQPIEVGASLERLGHFIDALQFYERIEREGDLETQQIAAARWLVVKNKQVALLKQQGSSRPSQITKADLDYRNKLHDWLRRNPDKRSVEALPSYPLLKPEQKTSVSGAPPEAEIDENEHRVRLTVDHLEVTAIHRKSLLRLTAANADEVEINLVSGEVRTDDDVAVETVESGDSTSFVIPAFRCTATFFRSFVPVRVDLSINGRPPFAIEFRTAAEGNGPIESPGTTPG